MLGDPPEIRLEKMSQQEKDSLSLDFNNLDSELLKSVIDADKKSIEDGELVIDSINRGISSFSPEDLNDQIINNFSMARNILGDSLLRLLSGYNPGYLQRNIRIPEFRRELLKNIEDRLEKLKDSGILDDDGGITDKGVELASLVSYIQEIEHLRPFGFYGEKQTKKLSVYGDKSSTRHYRKGDRYRDISIRGSVNIAVRRGSRTLKIGHLRSHDRKTKGKTYVIYALDASGSMKGTKLEMCKKAGIALSFRAIEEKDEVGLMIFGSTVKVSVPPTKDFTRLLKEITRARASRDTDIAATIRKSIELFPGRKATKHLILITDAMPTAGKQPEKSTTEAVSLARQQGITLSLVGINISDKSKQLAGKMAEIGGGRLYMMKDTENLDAVVLEDYYSL